MSLILLDLEIPGFFRKRLKAFAPAVIELSKELHELEPVGMYICPQHIYGYVEDMSYHEYEYEYERSVPGRTQHGSHLIEYLGYDACGKSQSQQSGVGKYVRQIAGHSIGCI